MAKKNSKKTGKSSTIPVLLIITLISAGILAMLMAALLIKKDKDKRLQESYKQINSVLNNGENQTGNSTEDGQDTTREESDIESGSENAPDVNTEETTNSSAVDIKPEELKTQLEMAYDENFYVSTIGEGVFKRINGISYTKESPVALEDLRYVHIKHVGANGEDMTGELIVNKAIAEDVLDIFYELYKAEYPIEKVALVDEFAANDNISMAINNTSGFNARKVEGTTVWSEHAYGLAIDINPLYNPYVNNDIDDIKPASGRDYADRTGEFVMKIDKEDLCYKLFTEHGFTWGGDWKYVKDYMHFEKAID